MSNQQTRVIIVDDEEGIRGSLKNYLDDFDYAVSVAESSEQALELLEVETFDIGIIDLRLPRLSGDKLITLAHVINPSMRFLIHTGSSDFTLPTYLRAIGMESQDIVYKPTYDLNQFVEHLERLSKTTVH